MKQLSIFDALEEAELAVPHPGSSCKFCGGEMHQVAERGWACSKNHWHRFWIQTGLGIWSDLSAPRSGLTSKPVLTPEPESKGLYAAIPCLFCEGSYPRPIDGQRVQCSKSPGHTAWIEFGVVFLRKEDGLHATGFAQCREEECNGLMIRQEGTPIWICSQNKGHRIRIEKLKK